MISGSWSSSSPKHRSEALDFEFERNETTGRKPVRVTLPPTHFVDFGFRLAIEPISAIRKGSPAEKASFRKGDKIISVDGRDDFDPMRLPDLCYEHAGRPLTFRVERPVAGPGAKVEELTATPDDSPPVGRGDVRQQRGG